MTHDPKMFELAKNMLPNAYSPYSLFKVACCIKTSSGHYYTGCNVENIAYGLTTCAEASAISQMIAAGEKEINAVVIIAESDKTCTPCGACRQRIREFAHDETPIHMGTHLDILQTTPLGVLLPYSFGPENIKRK